MKVVIDILEDRYKDIQRIAEVQLENCHFKTAEQIIANGTPLPKGHGRLIDAEDVKRNHEKWIGYLDDDMIARLNIAIDNHVKTIIEADKAENKTYGVEVISRGNCILCGKELTEGLLFCKECETKVRKRG